MKSRKLILSLATFSLALVTLDGGEHLLKAKTAKLLLSISKPGDPEIERTRDSLRDQYESIGSAAVSVIALGFLIFTVARNR